MFVPTYQPTYLKWRVVLIDCLIYNSLGIYFSRFILKVTSMRDIGLMERNAWDLMPCHHCFRSVLSPSRDRQRLANVVVQHCYHHLRGYMLPTVVCQCGLGIVWWSHLNSVLFPSYLWLASYFIGICSKYQYWYSHIASACLLSVFFCWNLVNLLVIWYSWSVQIRQLAHFTMGISLRLRTGLSVPAFQNVINDFSIIKW